MSDPLVNGAPRPGATAREIAEHIAASRDFTLAPAMVIGSAATRSLGGSDGPLWREVHHRLLAKLPEDSPAQNDWLADQRLVAKFRAEP